MSDKHNITSLILSRNDVTHIVMFEGTRGQCFSGKNLLERRPHNIRIYYFKCNIRLSYRVRSDVVSSNTIGNCNPFSFILFAATGGPSLPTAVITMVASSLAKATSNSDASGNPKGYRLASTPYMVAVIITDPLAITSKKKG